MIYQNKDLLPKVFISLSTETECPNQNLYRTNYIKQFIEQQEDANEKATKSMKSINQNISDNQKKQEEYFSIISSQLTQQDELLLNFNDQIINQELANQATLVKMENVEKLNHDLKNKLESNDLINQVIIDQLSNQDHITQEIARNMQDNEVMLKSISLQLVRHEELQQQLNEKLELQEVFHQVILERINHQEALTEKITRQIEHLKGVVFERFSHLSDKLEASLKHTSNFILDFFPNSFRAVEIKDEKEKEYSKQ